jgi:TonB family protein
MKKICTFVIFLIMLAEALIYAQRATPTVEDRFKNGYVRFYFTLNQNLAYPAPSEERNTIGMSVSRVIITPEGKIEDVQIINSLDREIDRAVIEALKKTAPLWLKSDTLKSNQVFYVQIAFIISGGPDDFFFKSAYPQNKMFTKPVAIMTFPENDAGILMPKDDTYLSRECSNLVNQGKYEKALKLADEMIRRYPYTKQLYELRILISKKLNKNDNVEQDTRKIKDFAEGLSLDMLMLENEPD